MIGLLLLELLSSLLLAAVLLGVADIDADVALLDADTNAMEVNGVMDEVSGSELLAGTLLLVWTTAADEVAAAGALVAAACVVVVGAGASVVVAWVGDAVVVGAASVGVVFVSAELEEEVSEPKIPPTSGSTAAASTLIANARMTTASHNSNRIVKWKERVKEREAQRGEKEEK
jgi:peptidoglycan/LPS O-acetylase OafA/YrhL